MYSNKYRRPGPGPPLLDNNLAINTARGPGDRPPPTHAPHPLQVAWAPPFPSSASAPHPPCGPQGTPRSPLPASALSGGPPSTTRPCTRRQPSSRCPGSPGEGCPQRLRLVKGFRDSRTEGVEEGRAGAGAGGGGALPFQLRCAGPPRLSKLLRVRSWEACSRPSRCHAHSPEAGGAPGPRHTRLPAWHRRPSLCSPTCPKTRQPAGSRTRARRSHSVASGGKKSLMCWFLSPNHSLKK